MFTPLLLLLLWNAEATAYERWRADDSQPWIRVGLGKQASVVELFSPGPLLVLDGAEVVGRIEPKGEFRIVAERKGRGAQHWVQVQAAYNRKALQTEADRLANEYDDLNFRVTSTGSGRLYGLQAGPFAAKDAAETARGRLRRAGFDDAFLVKTGESRFAWVDSFFDKLPLRAEELALVRLDPRDPITFDGKPYRGVLRFRLQSGKLRVINYLPIETYLRGVVPTELGPRVFPEVEALKAQAVAARTYALKNMGRFRRSGYDICDGPACQAYEGMKNETALSDEAVRTTTGMVMYHEDVLIDALYTSTGGGHTADVGVMFPGRDEPYLRGKSEYLAEFKSWTLPEHPVSVKPEWAHLAAKALIYGYATPPDLDGPLTAESLGEALVAFSWILGEVGERPQRGRVDFRSFWRTIAKMPFFETLIANQFTEDDKARALAAFDAPSEFAGLAAVMLRYDIFGVEVLAEMRSSEKMSRVAAFERLIQLCERLGPEHEWDRSLVEGVSNNAIQVQEGLRPREIKLSGIRYYVTLEGDRYSFLDVATVEERDRVYQLEKPFRQDILMVRPNGGVASVDRFSVFDFWVDKKTVAQLEKRARRYVPKLRGLRDVEILGRSPEGRVTALALIGDSGRHQVKGLRVRWSLGVRDNLFDLLPSYQNGRLVHLTTVGRGWGHGVGMSQVGAYGLARMGWGFEDILKYYYTGIEVRAFDGR